MSVYVNNKEFTAEMAEYRKEYLHSIENDLPKPRLSDSIGEKILLIANHIAYRPNFSGYTYLDDMIEDAIEDMVTRAHNFDPEKSSNAFAYFSQIAFYAFVRRIKKEKAQFRTKVKMAQNNIILSDVLDSRQQQDSDEEYNNSYIEYLMNYYDTDLSIGEEQKKATSEDEGGLSFVMEDEWK